MCLLSGEQASRMWRWYRRRRQSTSSSLAPASIKPSKGVPLALSTVSSAFVRYHADTRIMKEWEGGASVGWAGSGVARHGSFLFKIRWGVPWGIVTYMYIAKFKHPRIFPSYHK